MNLLLVLPTTTTYLVPLTTIYIKNYIYVMYIDYIFNFYILPHTPIVVVRTTKTINLHETIKYQSIVILP
jgi:hypothetical protein